MVHDVLKRPGRDVVGEVEPVDVGLILPLRQLCCGARAVADDHRTETADADPLGQLPHRPHLVLPAGSLLEGLHGGLDGVGLHITDGLVEIETAEVQPHPARHQHQRAFGVHVLGELVVLRLGGLLARSGDNRLHRKDAHAVGVASRLDGGLPNPLHRFSGELLGGWVDEHRLSVLAGEGPAPRGGARLVDHRGALRGRLYDADPGGLEVFAVVLDAVNLRRVGEDAGGLISHDGVVLPGAFQQLIDHLQVLIGVIVAGVVLHLVVLAHILGGRGQIAGHHVPPHPTAGQMIQGPQAAGKRVGVLIGGAGSDAEPEILGDCCHS